MISLLLRHRVSGLSLLVACATAGLGWAVSATVEPAGNSATPHTTRTAIPDMPVRTFDAKYEASIDRPLFFQTRRPAPAKPSQVSAPEQPEPPAKPLNATLVGVAISPEKRMVVIKLATGKNVTLAEGEALDGWQLTRVKPELAEFHNKTATAELTFPFRPTSAAQPVATAAPTTLLRRRQ